MRPRPLFPSRRGSDAVATPCRGGDCIGSSRHVPQRLNARLSVEAIPMRYDERFHAIQTR